MPIRLLGNTVFAGHVDRLIIFRWARFRVAHQKKFTPRNIHSVFSMLLNRLNLAAWSAYLMLLKQLRRIWQNTWPQS